MDNIKNKYGVILEIASSKDFWTVQIHGSRKADMESASNLINNYESQTTEVEVSFLIETYLNFNF